MIRRYCIFFFYFLFFLCAISGCFPSQQREVNEPEKALIPVRYGMPRFHHDDMDIASLVRAIEKNTGYLERLAPDHRFQYGPHQFTCRQVQESYQSFLQLLKTTSDTQELARLIKRHFNVYQAAGRTRNHSVLFTGYYEPLFDASLTPDPQHRYPIYRKPDDMIKLDLTPFSTRLQGLHITARIEGKKVLPYFSREEIETNKALTGKGLEIAWLKDPIDVAFLHIQGSGQLQLPDGGRMSVGYEASNGREYRSIGRYLIEKGYISKEEMSMQAIRHYLSTHPDIIEEVLNYNLSYIFFRVRPDGPYGNINVPLTAGRSIALNSSLFPKGALCFITTEKPVFDATGTLTHWETFSRFVLNQDTGGAITGAGRVDLFWGSGRNAELSAGHMKQEGELFVLIKKPNAIIR